MPRRQLRSDAGSPSPCGIVAPRRRRWCSSREPPKAAPTDGVTHEIRNAGLTPLKTLDLYVPPAYSVSGRPLSRGRP